MNIWPIIVIMLCLSLTTCSEDEANKKSTSAKQKLRKTNGKTSSNRSPNIRVGRQNNRREPQPPGIFFAITSLAGGFVGDSVTAYRNITRLVSQAFSPPRNNGTTGNVTTTNFTLRSGIALLGRNYRGLRRLFDTEFARALNDSDRNVAEFSREFKTAVRPFLQITRTNRSIS